MSVASILDITNPAYLAESIRVYDLYVDGTAYGLTGGALAPGLPNTFLRTTNINTVQWQPFVLADLPGGTTGTFLRSGVTGGTGGIHWGYIDNTDIDPGTSDQLFVTNSAGNAVQWSSNIRIPGTLGVTGASTFTGNGLFQGDLAVTNDLNVLNGDLVVGNGQLQVLVGDSVLQDTAIDGNLTFNTSSGVTGQVPIKTSTSTQTWGNITASLITPGVDNRALMTRSGAATFSNIIPSDVVGGSINQVLQSDGTSGQWVTNVTLPGNLTMGAPSITSLYETRLLAALKLGGNNSGTTGMVCVADGSSVPHWEYPQYFSLWYQNSPVQDLNDSPTVLLMDNASVDVSNANISYNGTGMWSVAERGNYNVFFRCAPSVVGAGAQSVIYFRINGQYAGSVYTTVTTGIQSTSLNMTYRLDAGSTIEVVSSPVVAGKININGIDPQGIATTTLCITRLGPYV